MGKEDVSPLAFCPSCGAKVRRSIAERFGIGGDDLSLLMVIFVVSAALVLIVAAIVGGVVYNGVDQRAHEANMARQGYVQKTKNLDPATQWRPGVNVTEWVKEEKK